MLDPWATNDQPNDFWGGGPASIVPNTAPTIDFQGRTLPATTTPGVYDGKGPTTTAASGYTGAKDFASIVRWWQSQHPAQTPDLPGLIAFLNSNGVNVSNAVHNGMQSDDKLIYNGQTYDLGSSLGSPNGSWFSNFSPMGSGNNAVGDFGSLLQPFTGQAPPMFAASKAFDYPDFKAPTGDELLKADPGYLFRIGQGEQALQQSAAARGVLNSGGTLRDLLDYGQKAASQEYGKFYDRSLSEYNTNRANQFGNYGANYDTGASDYQRAYDSYLDQYNQFRNRQIDTNNFLTDQQKIGASTI